MLPADTECACAKMASTRGHQLVRRLRKVLQRWPSDPSRKGRDLGEYLKKSYETKFKEELSKNVRPINARTCTCGAHSASAGYGRMAHGTRVMHIIYETFFLLQDEKAREIVECLERLDSNHYRRLYKRDSELGFSEGAVANNPWILSNGKKRRWILKPEMYRVVSN